MQKSSIERILRGGGGSSSRLGLGFTPLRHSELVSESNNSQAEGLTPHPSPLPKGEGVHGFTLAEVLITLGIIGVVAALTLPTLIQHHRKSVIETKLAKFYSIVNQAVALTNSEYGDPENWVKDCGGFGAQTCSADDTTEWFKQYIGKHLQYTKIEKLDSAINVYLADGSIFNIANHIYDMTFIENEKAKNNIQLGRNAFAFGFSPSLLPSRIASADILKYAIKPTIEPYTTYWNGTREDLFVSTRVSGFGCGENGGHFCTKLIQMNGWKIPSDYPIKF